MKKLILLLSAVIPLFFAGCSNTSDKKSIAVFVPGIIDNNPVYEMLVQGVKNAADKYNQNNTDKKPAEVFIFEAGSNQAEWGTKLTALAASGKYSVIISSNPSLPELAVPLTQKFPAQKFILLDAELPGNQNIYTCCYNQYEQAYLTGLIAGYMSKTHKIALIAAQEYPVMNNIIYPSFEKGAKKAYEGTSSSFLVIGNWYDATKGAQLADTAIAGGADVLLPICGGASAGVLNSAINSGKYITWFDDNGFSKAPGTVISSTTMKQEKMAEIVTSDYLAESIKWGQADTVGIREGFVEFVQDDPLYISTVPEEIRAKMKDAVSEIEKGQLIIR